MSDFEEIEQTIKKIKKHKQHLIAQKNSIERQIEKVNEFEKEIFFILLNSVFEDIENKEEVK